MDKSIDNPPLPAQAERKVITGVQTDAQRQALVLRGRGPLDTRDTIVEMSYTLLKSLAGQLIQQEAEAATALQGGIIRPH